MAAIEKHRVFHVAAKSGQCTNGRQCSLPLSLHLSLGLGSLAFARLHNVVSAIYSCFAVHVSVGFFAAVFNITALFSSSSSYYHCLVSTRNIQNACHLFIERANW